MAGVTIAALTGSDSAPSKANEASQKQDIGAAKDDVSLAVTNAITDAYQTAYVETGISAGEASTKVGTEVIKAIAQKYQTNNQIGNATIEIEGFGTISNVTGDAKVTISTTDFLVEGTIYKDGGKLTWGEILPNQPSITITNPPESIAVNTTATLTADIKRATGNPTITWTSGDETKATVNNIGVVTGVAEGTATITATTNVDGTNYSGTCQITIISPPKRGDYIILNSRAITGVGPANTDNTSNTSNTDDWMILYNGMNETSDNDKKGLFIIMSNYLPNAYKASDDDTNSVSIAAGLDTNGTYGVHKYGQNSLINILKPTNNTSTAATAWKSLISNNILTTYPTTKVYGALDKNTMDKIKGKSGYYRSWSSKYQSTNGYWLASPEPDDAWGVRYVYYNGSYQHADSRFETDVGVCPIIILPQDVQLKKNANGVWEVITSTANNN